MNEPDTHQTTPCRRHCLILAEADDVHVQQVIQHSAVYPQVDYTIINTEEALRKWQTSLYFDLELKKWCGTLNGSSFADIYSIWYRRPKHPSAKWIEIAPAMARLAEEEMQGVLQNFYRIINCRLLPYPAADRKADFKLRQLHWVAGRSSRNVSRKMRQKMTKN